MLFCSQFRASEFDTYQNARRKLWDTYSGNELHTFPHNHIVRTVALSPSGSHLLTGGQEKKVRLFDLRRPDAEPEYLFESGASQSHDGTIKSVAYAGDNIGVTAGEDGLVKYVNFRTRAPIGECDDPNANTLF